MPQIQQKNKNKGVVQMYLGNEHNWVFISNLGLLTNMAT